MMEKHGKINENKGVQGVQGVQGGKKGHPAHFLTENKRKINLF